MFQTALQSLSSERQRNTPAKVLQEGIRVVFEGAIVLDETLTVQLLFDFMLNSSAEKLLSLRIASITGLLLRLGIQKRFSHDLIDYFS
jgi:hypothetical protein